jgi:hypothetical protein
MLNEGMRGGDLTNLVLPLISVDEYESKIDEKKAIVIGFYVHDEEAAKDLNRFLQKCYVSLLDTDISPAPDQHGYYLVFVELLRDATLAKNVEEILSDVTPLTDIEEWQMRVRKTDDILTFSKKTFQKAIDKANKVDENRKIISFVMESDFTEVGFEDGRLVLATPKGKQYYSVLGFGNTNTVLESLDLVTVPANVTLNEAFRANKLQSLLGADWYVMNAKDLFIVHRHDTDECLVMKSTV